MHAQVIIDRDISYDDMIRKDMEYLALLAAEANRVRAHITMVQDMRSATRAPGPVIVERTDSQAAAPLNDDELLSRVEAGISGEAA